MSDGSAVLRKKVAPARAAMPGGSTVAAMLRKVFPRVADKILSLDVHVTDVRFGSASKDEVMDGLSEFDLIYLVAGEKDRRGIAAVTPGLLAALIEIQVSGRVTDRAASERPATQTDGIVVGDIVDRWMAAAKDAAEEDDISDALPTVGYVRTNRVLNLRNADLTLDPIDFKTLAIEMSVDHGAKTGVLTFALPPLEAENFENTANQRMRAHLADFEAPMVAILARLPVPIETVKNLSIDDVIDVPISSLVNVQIEGSHGQKIATARLGQLNGSKAVRLMGSAETDEGANASELGSFVHGDARSTLREPGDLLPAAMPALPNPIPEASDADASPVSMPEIETLPDLPPLDTPGNLPEPTPFDASSELPSLPDLPPLDP